MSLIVIEGLDGTGKTTLSRSLAEHLASRKPLMISFPDRATKTGKLIDAYLRGELEVGSAEEVHRMMALNRTERLADITAAMLDGRTVICDRYSYSGVAYSMAKGLKRAWCQMFDRNLPVPDVILYLEMDTPRMEGTERYEKVEFQRRVREAYAQLIDGRWVTLDANLSREDLLQKALDVLRERKCVCNEH